MKYFLAIAYFSASVTLLVGCGSSGNTVPSTSSSQSANILSSSARSSNVSSSAVSASSSSQPVPTECRVTAGNAGAVDVPGFYVEDGKLFDGHDNPFVMRGINYPYAWFHQRDTQQHFSDMAATCANSVRIVLSNGAHPGWRRVPGEEVTQLINLSKANNMVAILEVHDSTGWPQNSDAADPQTAVDYWLSDDIRTAIEGTEGFVIINIANEPLGNFNTAEQDRTEWLNFHTGAIESLREAGITHTLIVDAPNWGQDWTNSMRDGDAAQQVFFADALANTVFSVHMYDVYGTTADKLGRVKAYMDAFVDKNLPLIIGEFAADHGPGVENDVDQDAILRYAEEYGFGYLAWSWSGNGGNLGSLDIVLNFDGGALSPWGERLVNGNNGLRETSVMCSCFDSLTFTFSQP